MREFRGDLEHDVARPVDIQVAAGLSAAADDQRNAGLGPRFHQKSEVALHRAAIILGHPQREISRAAVRGTRVGGNRVCTLRNAVTKFFLPRAGPERTRRYENFHERIRHFGVSVFDRIRPHSASHPLQIGIRLCTMSPPLRSPTSPNSPTRTNGIILDAATLLNPALLGLAMVVTFMTLIMTKRMSAVAALIVLPIVFGLLAGAGPSVGKMMIEGVLHVTPTALMLAFAVLFFAIMMDAGLFDPLVRAVVANVGEDPMRISIGTMVLATVVSLDGDGTTTALIVVTAMLPVYRKVGMNPLVLATLLALCNALLNLVPWGGPAARAAVALQVDLMDIFLPLIPSMGVGLLSVFGIAWLFGRSERRRLAQVPTPR